MAFSFSSLSAEVANILAEVVVDSLLGDASKEPKTQALEQTFPTGDIIWISNGSEQLIYAYNQSNAPITLTFANTTPAGCVLKNVTVDPYYSYKVSDYLNTYSGGAVTITPNTALTTLQLGNAAKPNAAKPGAGGPSAGGPITRAISFSVRALALSSAVNIAPNVGVRVTSDPGLVVTVTPNVTAGNFLATVTNGDQSATVSSDVTIGDVAADTTIPLPEFLGLGVQDSIVDQLQIIMSYDTYSYYNPAARRKGVTFQGKPKLQPKAS
jgi:hypothetical protein